MLLVPQVSSALTKAKETGIKTNFRDYHIAMESYAFENKNTENDLGTLNSFLSKELQFNPNPNFDGELTSSLKSSLGDYYYLKNFEEDFIKISSGDYSIIFNFKSNNLDVKTVGLLSENINESSRGSLDGMDYIVYKDGSVIVYNFDKDKDLEDVPEEIDGGTVIMAETKEGTAFPTIASAISKNVEEIVSNSDNNFSDTLSYDEDGFVGELIKEGDVDITLLSGVDSVSKNVSESITSDTNSFEATFDYNEDGFVGSLNKKNEPIKNVISGSAADSKSASEVKKSTSNNFASTIAYDADGYAGTLNKGSVSSRVTGTVPSGYNESYTYQEWQSNWQNVKVGTETVQTGTREEGMWQCEGDIAPDAKVTGTGTHNSETGCTYVYFAFPVYETRDVYESQDKGGYVTKTGTRWVDTSYNTYEYTTTYTGTVSKPDTRVYNYTQEYSGTVSSPDTRTWTYKQTYSGTVRKAAQVIWEYR